MSAHVSTRMPIQMGLSFNKVSLSFSLNQVLIFSSHKLLSLGIMHYSPEFDYMGTSQLARIELCS